MPRVQVTSLTCELVAPYFSAGACEEFLTFLANFEKVQKGQNIASDGNKFALARRLLEGGALTAFKQAVKEKPEKKETLKAGFEAIEKNAFPSKAARPQKRYLARFLEKPKHMGIRECMARSFEINNHSPLFPKMGDPTTYCSLNPTPPNEKCLPGGLLQLTHGKHSGRITSFNKDNYSGWVSQSLCLKNNKFLTIITACRPNDTTLDPLSNAIAQQQC